MTQRRVIEIMLERYGIMASVNNRQLHAMIRPLQYKNGASSNLPAEYYDNLNYLYTGPAEQKLQIGDEVITSERSYVVKRSDTTEISGEEVYVWAVVKALAPDADREVYLEADGLKIATVGGYAAQVVQQSRTVAAWGEQEPVGTAAGAVSYELTLKNVCPAENIDLYALADFRLVAVRPGLQVVYSGCSWKNISTAGGAGNQTCLEMQLSAAKREEQKEAKTDG
jgi:hypothetical protein